MNGFDAIKYIGELREAGVPEKQAEVHLRILHEVIESNLATKRDIQEVKRDIKELEQRMELKINEVKRDIQEVRREIQELRNEVKRDIKELEQRMTIKLGALVVVTIGILVALSNLQII